MSFIYGVHYERFPFIIQEISTTKWQLLFEACNVFCGNATGVKLTRGNTFDQM